MGAWAKLRKSAEVESIAAPPPATRGKPESYHFPSAGRKWKVPAIPNPDGNLFYHGTHADAVPSIRAVGFRPSEDGTAGRGVYLTRDPDRAASLYERGGHAVSLAAHGGAQPDTQVQVPVHAKLYDAGVHDAKGGPSVYLKPHVHAAYKLLGGDGIMGGKELTEALADPHKVLRENGYGGVEWRFHDGRHAAVVFDPNDVDHRNMKIVRAPGEQAPAPAPPPKLADLSDDQRDLLDAMQRASLYGDHKQLASLKELAPAYDLTDEHIAGALGAADHDREDRDRQNDYDRLDQLEQSPSAAIFPHIGPDGNLKKRHPYTGKPIRARTRQSVVSNARGGRFTADHDAVWHLPGSGYDELADAALASRHGNLRDTSADPSLDEFYSGALRDWKERRDIRQRLGLGKSGGAFWAAGRPLLKADTADAAWEREQQRDAARITPRQWTPEERAANLADWHQGSKIVNADGSPKVVYHGTSTPKHFDSFKVGKRGQFGQGIYFTDDPEYAGSFAGGGGDETKGDSPRIVPAHLRIRNPYTWGSAPHIEALPEQQRDREIRRKHDGIVVPPSRPGLPTQYAIFKPEQAKSAVGNDGTYHSGDPRLTKSDEVQPWDRPLSDLLREGAHAAAHLPHQRTPVATGRTFYHVAPPSYRPGDHLYSAASLKRRGVAVSNKWGDEAPGYMRGPDAKHVSLAESYPEAVDYLHNFGEDGSHILAVDVPHGVKLDRNGEGYPQVRSRVPAEWIRPVPHPRPVAKSHDHWRSEPRDQKGRWTKVAFAASVGIRSALDAIRSAGGKTYVVGGYPRDLLLGGVPKDYDFETFGLPPDVLDAALAGIGKVDAVGRSFGVSKVRTPQGDDLDFALPRTEKKTGAGHRGFVTEADPHLSPQAASARRDYTINALMLDPDTGEIIDHHGGIADLQAKVLRHVGPAFAEDPLRVLRGMQFAARYGFALAPETIALARDLAPEYHSLSKERVWGEWEKWAQKGAHPAKGIQALEQTGWLAHFPELAALRGVPQDPQHHPEGDALTHTMHVCDAMAHICTRERVTGDDRTVAMLAALCHDLGKAVEGVTVHEADGRITSRGHDAAGVEPTMALLERIGCPLGLRAKIAVLVREHMARNEGAASVRVVRRLAARLAPHATVADWDRVVEADVSGRPPKPASRPGADWVRMAEELGASDGKPKPIVGGKALIARGFKPGVEFSPILGAAYDAQLDGALDADNADDWLDTYLAQRPTRKGWRGGDLAKADEPALHRERPAGWPEGVEWKPIRHSSYQTDVLMRALNHPHYRLRYDGSKPLTSGEGERHSFAILPGGIDPARHQRIDDAWGEGYHDTQVATPTPGGGMIPRPGWHSTNDWEPQGHRDGDLWRGMGHEGYNAFRAEGALRTSHKGRDSYETGGATYYAEDPREAMEYAETPTESFNHAQFHRPRYVLHVRPPKGTKFEELEDGDGYQATHDAIPAKAVKATYEVRPHVMRAGGFVLHDHPDGTRSAYSETYPRGQYVIGKVATPPTPKRVTKGWRGADLAKARRPEPDYGHWEAGQWFPGPGPDPLPPAGSDGLPLVAGHILKDGSAPRHGDNSFGDIDLDKRFAAQDATIDRMAGALKGDPDFAGYAARHHGGDVTKAVRAMKGAWMGSSTPEFGSLHRAAAEQFGIGGPHRTFSDGELPAADHPAAAAYIRQAHRLTQADLAQHGLSTVRLWRGVNPANADKPAAPLTAWSAQRNVAAQYAGDHHRGIVEQADVPAHQIVATPRSGLGDYTSAEYVVARGARPPVTKGWRSPIAAGAK